VPAAENLEQLFKKDRIENAEFKAPAFPLAASMPLKKQVSK